ncbi:MAG: nitroreductase [Anaerolineales bacterium]|jgi:nitroreductase
MDVLEIIRTRHSIAKVKPDPLPRNLVEKLLNAAVQAPNHHHSRPWRFVVLTGPGRERLGEVMAQSLKKQKSDLPDSALDIERAKPLRAPLLIAVGVEKSSDPRVLEIEDICAAAAAVENMLLAAHALGLGAMWRTGPPARDPLVKQFLGFAPDQPLIGFIYVGYPDVQPDFTERPSFEDRTVWVG